MSEISRYVIQGHLDTITHYVIQGHLAAITYYVIEDHLAAIISKAVVANLFGFFIHACSTVSK